MIAVFGNDETAITDGSIRFTIQSAKCMENIFGIN
jgi:hypothetical protein